MTTSDPKINIIETERLLLRELTPDICNAIFSTFTDDEAIAFFGLNSVEDLIIHKRKLTTDLVSFRRSFVLFQLIDKITKNLIGSCGYHTWFLLHRRAEIGYEIYDEDYKNKGLMKEAIVPIIKYGFNEMQLNRIEAFIGPDNISSQKLIKGCGFTQEGIMREHFYKNNEFQDSVAFSLLKSEYEGMK